MEIALKNHSTTTRNEKQNEIPEVETNQDDIKKPPKIIILHDSLCGKINDTILSRENVTVKKVWAPNILEIKKKINEMEYVDALVIQSLTRDLEILSIEEMETQIKEIVSMASLKANKIIISGIVGREDNHDIRMKADVINASTTYNYYNDDNVIFCNNDNLRESKFRLQDKIHLTPHGTSVLENNLKYSIAKALCIDVIKKQRHKNKYTRGFWE